jgi:hypothetical protein
MHVLVADDAADVLLGCGGRHAVCDEEGDFPVEIELRLEWGDFNS